MQINRVYNEDCLETMNRMPDNFVDLAVTSPPYDDLRTYNGYHFEYQDIIENLYLKMKTGGVVVWIVADAKVDGSETGTSFKQALYFMECGFKLNDTMIWEKGSFTAVGALKTQYAPTSEYMFVFTKGKLKTFNPIKDRPNKWAGTKNHAKVRQKDGSLRDGSGYGKIYNDFGIRFNVWHIPPEKRPGGYKGHPAVFPDQLAGDHIISWSNVGDVVYDPMCGSGTTLRVAKKLGRNYLGSEISSEYCDIAQKLLNEV